MVTVIVEDGSVVPNANSYVSVAEANDYFSASLYPLPWATATDDQKAAAVITASRIVDQSYEYFGYRVNTQQSMGWPRQGVPDRETRGGYSIGFYAGNVRSGYYPPNVIPAIFKQGIFEMAKIMLAGDRTADPDQLGIQSVALGSGALEVVFDQKSVPPTVSFYVKQILSRFGTVINQSGIARLIRT